MHFLALILWKICLYSFKVIFGHNGMKIGENVYFYWPKIAFYSLKLHFGIFKVKLQKRPQKGLDKA